MLPGDTTDLGLDFTLSQSPLSLPVGDLGSILQRILIAQVLMKSRQQKRLGR